MSSLSFVPLAGCLLFLAALPRDLRLPTPPQVEIVATQPVLAALAQELGGGAVRVRTLGRPGHGPHDDSLCTDVHRFAQRGGVLLCIGPGEQRMVNEAYDELRALRPLPPARVVECSRGVDLIHDGDALHAGTNPHCWLEPASLRVIAVHVTHALCDARPDQRCVIRERARAFLREVDRRTPEWSRRLQPVAGDRVVSAHGSLAYLARFARIRVIATMDQSSPSELEALMRRERVQHVLIEPWNEEFRTAHLAIKCGGRMNVLRTSVPEGDRVLDHFDALVNELVAALAP